MYLSIVNTVALLLFVVGLYGVMTSKVGIKMLISVEIMINGAVLNLVAASHYVITGYATEFQSMQPIVLALFVIAIAAVESVVGISLLIAIYRRYGKVNISLLRDIKG